MWRENSDCMAQYPTSFPQTFCSALCVHHSPSQSRSRTLNYIFPPPPSSAFLSFSCFVPPALHLSSLSFLLPLPPELPHLNLPLSFHPPLLFKLPSTYFTFSRGAPAHGGGKGLFHCHWWTLKGELPLCTLWSSTGSHRAGRLAFKINLNLLILPMHMCTGLYPQKFCLL